MICRTGVCAVEINSGWTYKVHYYSTLVILCNFIILLQVSIISNRFQGESFRLKGICAKVLCFLICFQISKEIHLQYKCTMHNANIYSLVIITAVELVRHDTKYTHQCRC